MGSFIYRLRLTVTCAFSFSGVDSGLHFSLSAALAWARLSASSSSSGAPERKPAASVDACLSHFGECLTELASSYSLDGLVTLVVKKRLGGEFNLMCLVL